jgi:transposase-like protein
VNDDLIRPDGSKRHRTATEIRAILSDHQLSGLSLVAFARHHQLCYASLLRWRSRYSSEGGQAASHSEFSDEPVLKPRFVPVRMDPDPTNGTLDGFVIAWSAGKSLRVPDSFNPQQLRRLLDVLGWQP